MGGKPRIVQVIVAFIAVLLLMFSVMPQFFLTTASQVSPPVEFSLSPHQCGLGMTHVSESEKALYYSTWSAGLVPVRPFPGFFDPLGINIPEIQVLFILLGTGCTK